ncbi:MAG: Smr/MutS family protein [Bacteroidaceae bacterium]|nr:Smr/MutS family protein [Bacteroidaceae bacterium]
MIYPKTFENKIGFSEIRQMLKDRCLGTFGRELVDSMEYYTVADDVREQLLLVTEFRTLKAEVEQLPLDYFFDVREQLYRARIEGTHLEEEELFDLRRVLLTVSGIVKLLSTTQNAEDYSDFYDEEQVKYCYPHLHKLTEDVDTFPKLQQDIDKILDRQGKIKDTASVQLLNIRRDLRRMEGTVSAILNRILREAQRDGLIEKDVTPAMRDGRLVLPVNPAMKKRVQGIVHDESATGKTVFIEPAAVVEANNRIRDLENEERRELINILKNITSEIRPLVDSLMFALEMLAKIDFVQAKTSFAESIKAVEPTIEDRPVLDWVQARHPLLQISLAKEGRQIVPLDVLLTHKKRILIISGPNAGGKSVCLKTVGLLQYMLQMGLPIPVSENSKTCLFENIFIDIGDEQSIENDLSTYSGHLLNMKNMMRHANARTLILIDEFGTGTEPLIGGAIAEAVLEQFCKRKAYGVITTHYQNLKHFADSHEMVANGAMLYDRHKMEALFQLAIGRPGSSFAVEIARKIGLPEDVIARATELVGSEHIDSDKYLQDIVRDKRYWESKRQNIHQQEKQLEKTITSLESSAQEVQSERKAIIRKAKQEAEELLKEANKRIENTIREIREAQAAKEATHKLRQELEDFRSEVQNIQEQENDEKIARKIAQIQGRRERHAKRMKEKQKAREDREANGAKALSASREASDRGIQEGDTVKIKGLTSVGTVLTVKGKNAVVDFNGMKTTTPIDSLLHTTVKSADTNVTKTEARYDLLNSNHGQSQSGGQYDIVDARNHSFKQQLDLRGFRADEALIQLTNYIDDAILLGATQVRILHGTGTGALRQITRQYLQTVPNVRHFRDEHVQFGGAGITVVEL